MTSEMMPGAIDAPIRGVVPNRDGTPEERELDQILADSFPASDPPPWTLGVTHRERVGRATLHERSCHEVDGHP
jgi:hypothetical protein